MAARLKEMLRAGQLTRVFGMGQLCHPKLVEMVGLVGGFDAVWFDQEHAGLSIVQIEEAARAARGSGLDSFVRLAPTDYASVMRVLEAGTGGLMAAQVANARQAETLVRWSKFHPRGERGINSTGADAGFGTLRLADYLARANAETLVVVQIERADALADLEAIVRVPDIDVLFIGPADLSQSLGIPGAWEDPRFLDAIQRVADLSNRSGVAWGILPPTPDLARRCVDLGCRMLSLGFDVWALARGIRAFQTEYADFFPSRTP